MFAVACQCQNQRDPTNLVIMVSKIEKYYDTQGSRQAGKQSAYKI